MKPIYIILSMLGCVFSLWGCSNAANYYHSERASLTLETKTADPQSPAQGNFGLKTRTVLVAPGRNDSTINPKPGEATSVVSDFNLNVEDVAGTLWPKTEIQSAFITGKAAIKAPAASIKAVSGLGEGQPGLGASLYSAGADNLYAQLKVMADKGKDASATQFVENLDKLADLLPNQQALTGVVTYDEGGGNLQQRDLTSKLTALNKPGFPKVIAYLNILNTGITTANELAEDPYTFPNLCTGTGAATCKPMTATELAAVKSGKEILESQKQVFVATIGNHPVIDNAFTYLISKY